MPIMTRLVLFIYNLFILAIAGAVVAVSLGWSAPLTFLNAAAATAENRIIMGTVGLILVIIVLMVLLAGLKAPAGIKTVVVETSTAGEVSMSIPAIKAIIMKAVKQVAGVKEIKPSVGQSTAGLTIKLHAMINPEHNVPEVAQSLQAVVKDQLEKVGGLQVAEVKVLVDDFNPESK
jgi:uncharacterized alkaline shock family protein YloU